MRMSKAKIWGVLAVSALSAGGVMLAWGQTPLKPTHNADELPALMRAKLASSQKVVEGLVAEDFDMIHKGALEMTKICDATEWHASDDQVYAHYRSELRRSAKKLMLLAEEKNLDGSAYTYMHSLTTCISCHEYSRDVLHIATKNPNLKVVPIPANDGENGPDRRRALSR